MRYCLILFFIFFSMISIIYTIFSLWETDNFFIKTALAALPFLYFFTQSTEELLVLDNSITNSFLLDIQFTDAFGNVIDKDQFHKYIKYTFYNESLDFYGMWNKIRPLHKELHDPEGIFKLMKEMTWTSKYTSWYVNQEIKNYNNNF